MSHVNLTHVLALNEELAALAEVGSCSNLVSPAAREALARELAEIDASLATGSEGRQSLLQAVSENQKLPPLYRSALESGLLSQHLTTTLDGIGRQANATMELRNTMSRALLPPLIIFVLVYVGFILLCCVYAPAIAGMYEQVGESPGYLAQSLVTMRTWLPYWATAVPLLLVAVVWWYRGWEGWPHLLPGARRYLQAVRQANFTRQLIALLESGTSLQQGLPVAAAVTGDAKLIAASQALAAAEQQQRPLASDAAVLRPLPPLLRWALRSNLEHHLEILQVAERMYRHQAAQRALTSRTVFSAILSAWLGGLLVLAYGLSLFGPFVQLLQDLAR